MAMLVFEPDAQIVVAEAATSITWVFSFLLDDRWLYEAAWECKRKGKVVALATEKDRGSVLTSPSGHGCVPKSKKRQRGTKEEKGRFG